MNKKKIIFYRGDQSACFVYRGHFPLAELGRNHESEYQIDVTGVLSSDQIGKYDVAIMQRQYKQEVFGPMLEMKKRGTKIIYEIDDDLFGVPKWSTAYKELGKRSVKENFKYFLSNVDAIFVTTEQLASRYRPYCGRIYVLPNSLDLKHIYPSPNNSKRKVICWQGSTTHEKDLSLIEPAIKKLVNDEDVLVKMWSYDYPGTYKVPYVSMEDFYKFMSQLDISIGLAPLTTIPFNRGKSNIKFIEYSAFGAATVASDFGPYAETIEHEKTGILISDNRDWYDAIRHLIDNEDIRRKLADNAFEEVKSDYDIGKNYLMWKNAIDEVLGLESKTATTAFKNNINKIMERDNNG